ncbi:hypothetical protein L1987_20831 [Smallanthus sonchifolius]|uniref:Uncharacterized protein n=1 Tax=Smallanthus sonchifolius TaxID=185202 RepID=A0ACB9IT64_9ASTR|nr:hypothetical protein L1987_20831 [Smallanthus sonchifolius]
MNKALLDLGASVSILPGSLYDQYDFGPLRRANTTVVLADLTPKLPRGIARDVIVKVDQFYYPVDFLVLDYVQSEKELELDLQEEEKVMEALAVQDGIPPWTHHVESLPTEIDSGLKPSLEQKEALLKVLKDYKAAIGWTIADLKGVSPSIVMHKIITDADAKPSWDTERRLNPTGCQEGVGAVLGQKVDKKPVVIYYASKTLSDAQLNYTITENELLAVVYALDKFRSYIWGSKEFNLEIRDKKGCENSVADHLSRIQREEEDVTPDINEQFPNECLMSITSSDPWYADLFKVGADQLIRQCIPESEIPAVLELAHASACGGHFSGQKIGHRTLSCGLFWPTIFKDAFEFARTCTNCQKMGSITKRNEMPMQSLLVVDIFDVWGIDFMGPFSNSFGNLYILVAVDYVSKWVEAITTKTNDHSVVLSNIFSRFGLPRVIISDGGSHFKNFHFGKLLKRYGVDHRIATPYHLQTSKQRRFFLSELEKLRDDAYESASAYKDKMKKVHDANIRLKNFTVGQKVWLFNSWLKLFPGKLKSKWTGPYLVTKVGHSGDVEIEDFEDHLRSGNNSSGINGRQHQYGGGEAGASLGSSVNTRKIEEMIENQTQMLAHLDLQHTVGDIVKSLRDRQGGPSSGPNASVMAVSVMSHREERIEEEASHGAKMLEEPELNVVSMRSRRAEEKESPPVIEEEEPVDEEIVMEKPVEKAEEKKKGWR